jgi:small subunit ribosomal protein S21
LQPGSISSRAWSAAGAQQEIDLPVIKIRDNEPFEIAMKRFKKQCEKAGILSELKRREYYDKPSVRRKKKAAAARKRALKKQRRMAR